MTFLVICSECRQKGWKSKRFPTLAIITVYILEKELIQLSVGTSVWQPKPRNQRYAMLVSISLMVWSMDRMPKVYWIKVILISTTGSILGLPIVE